ncbi:MAG: RNA-directed DNA polymerase, partial [Bacteroidetes bacterium]|nr:RNA-directed DNA polymerase [Bacteroidota bacterium]
MKQSSLRTLRKRKKAFLALRDPQDLAELLEIPAYRLKLMAIKPQYHHFDIPKKDGSKRWIEDPVAELKYVQR